MRILTLFLGAMVLVATILPMFNTETWWIRIFDFPRIQIAVITVIAILLTFVYVDLKWDLKLPLLLILAVAFFYQLHFVVVYTPIWKTLAKDSNKPIGESSLTLMVANVRMANEDKDSFHALVKKCNPDVLLVNEPDQDWAESISKLDGDFPYSIIYPLENTFGMVFLSKFPLSESAVNFFTKDYIPSIFTKITLRSGVVVDFYGVHPEPPKPGTDTYQRDTELLIIGNKIRETKNPTIVAGDLNDVGWSVTSKLFRRHSGLVDPREGRGLYNTYNVFVPLLRYPLDHIFYSKEFGLVSLEKLEDIGSDHYPLLIGLNYEPDGDNTEGLEKTDGNEKSKVQEKIEVGHEEIDTN